VCLQFNATRYTAVVACDGPMLSDLLSDGHLFSKQWSFRFSSSQISINGGKPMSAQLCPMSLHIRQLDTFHCHRDSSTSSRNLLIFLCGLAASPVCVQRCLFETRKLTHFPQWALTPFQKIHRTVHDVDEFDKNGLHQLTNSTRIDIFNPWWRGRSRSTKTDLLSCVSRLCTHRWIWLIIWQQCFCTRAVDTHP